jgi:hypothetical protein
MVAFHELLGLWFNGKTQVGYEAHTAQQTDGVILENLRADGADEFPLYIAQTIEGVDNGCLDPIF